MDLALRVGIVYGSAYLGSIKKLMFKGMYFLLSPLGVLPLHGAANMGPGDSALFLGLFRNRQNLALLRPRAHPDGDDEHGLAPQRILNFEWGCYAKMIDPSPEKEPDIFWAVMHETDPLEHGAIVENAFILTDGRFDFHDRRLTENSSASYPRSSIRNSDPRGLAGHPRALIFLTADANGVLSPLVKLEPDQAQLWFLMDYTSKLAGTETGVAKPGSTFSRFFGAPFSLGCPRCTQTSSGSTWTGTGRRCGW